LADSDSPVWLGLNSVSQAVFGMLVPVVMWLESAVAHDFLVLTVRRG
jgi:hypothetical protein